MTRVVIRAKRHIRADGSEEVSLILEEPSKLPHADESRAMDVDLGAAPFSDLAAIAPGDRTPLAGELVRVVGEKVLGVLNQHPAIRTALESSLTAGGAEPVPLLIETSASAAEAMPWELLYIRNGATGTFLSLDPKWPIVRLTSVHDARITRHFAPPLRLAAVVSAAARDGLLEWQALYDALKKSGVPYRVRLFLSEAPLRNQIEALADPDVEVRFVPASGEELIEAIREFTPHLLHFYCHGSADHQGYLEIATQNHRMLGESPVYLSTPEIGRLQESVWLVVLNACEGARPPVGLNSMAYALVRDGVPAAIGMREPIDSLDANLFCKHFYTEALKWIHAALVPGEEVLLDFSPMLRRARAALAEQFGPVAVGAALHKPWSLPILYQKPEGFSVFVTGTEEPEKVERHAEQVAELQTLRSLRAKLPPGTPQTFLDQVDAQIDALRTTLVAVEVLEHGAA